MSDYAWLLTYWLFLLAFVAVEQLAGDTRDQALPAKRWPTNVGFALLNGVAAATIPVTTVSAAIWAQHNGVGLLNVFALPMAAAIVLLVLVRTLAQYGFHRLAHAWPPLWSVHGVHHSDAHLDVTSGLRFHPIEWLASASLMVAVSIALGPPPEVLAVYEAVELLIGLATHTSLTLPAWLDRMLRVVVVTPSLHRLHHSDHAAETEHNYGALLPHWDMLFGTYRAQPIRPPEQFRVGLDTMAGKPVNNFVWLIEVPFSTSKSDAAPPVEDASDQAAHRDG